jgi:membrane protein YdbS with pleckstrin-like domain
MYPNIQIPSQEKILWQGGPDIRLSCIEGIFNPFLPFAIIWTLMDSLVLATGSNSVTKIFLVIHMMPVWIYLFGAITAGMRAKNTRYIITDRALYIQNGIFAIHTERSPLNEIVHTEISLGIIDKIFGLGDVLCICMHGTHRILNIKDYNEVSAILAKISEDTYTDTMYPNDYRPEENHGYKTKYRNFDTMD